MSEDKIRYDVLASEALRGIIRTVLQRVQKRGLPGDHHFYITFDTTASGTIISKRLKEQYPEEMTVVLQYQFWDFFVYDDRFEVKLSFNNVPERLVIPFAAIKTFVDPSVPFTFSPILFGPQPGTASPDAGSQGLETQDRGALPAPHPHGQNVEPAAKDPDSSSKDDEEPEQQTAEVVELDLFRKK